MLIQHIGGDLLTEIHLGFAIVPQMSLEFNDVEVEMIERGPHAVKPVFRFHEELVIAVRMRPFLLLLRQRHRHRRLRRSIALPRASFELIGLRLF